MSHSLPLGYLYRLLKQEQNERHDRGLPLLHPMTRALSLRPIVCLMIVYERALRAFQRT